MRGRLTLWSLAMAFCALAIDGQARQAAFDVVSVKRQTAETRGRGISVQPGGRFLAPSATVRELVAAAYGLEDIEIAGGAEWTGKDRFEIIATAPAGVTEAGARALLKTLLAERFRFAAHVERRELPVHLLVLSRDDRRFGPQLRRSGPECAPMKGPLRTVAAPAFVAAPPPPPAAGGPLVLDETRFRCPSLMANLNGTGHWSVREITLSQFARRLIREVGRPVIDRTGLEGPFDLDLTFASEGAVLGGAPSGDIAPLTTALRDQLGLRLDSARAPADVLVIDRVQPPTEN